MHYDGDYLFDQVKDDMILCNSDAEALQLADEYPTMIRFLPKEYKYYLYTVKCRRMNKFPKCQQLWECNQ